MEAEKKKKVINKIIEEINKSSFIVIAGHVSPDGDAAASCLALAMCISKLGKKPVVFLRSIPGRYLTLKGHEFVQADFISTDITPDLFICCDCGSKDRLGRFEGLFDKTGNTIVIDHHVSNISYGKINYIDFSASSTSEMVYDIIETVGNMDKDMAHALYMGILSDTGGFRFKSTSPATMVKVSKLMEMGIDFNTIYNETMLSHTYTEAKILSKAIEKMEFMDKLPIVYTFLTQEDMDSVAAIRADLDGIAEYMLNTKGAEISVFVSAFGDNAAKVSFRSLEFNVNLIASNWGGGGHVNAAGCTVNMQPEGALSLVLKHLSERYAYGN